MEGVTCNEPEGALYCMPRIRLSKKAIEVTDNFVNSFFSILKSSGVLLIQYCTYCILLCHTAGLDSNRCSRHLVKHDVSPCDSRCWCWYTYHFPISCSSDALVSLLYWDASQEDLFFLLYEATDSQNLLCVSLNFILSRILFLCFTGLSKFWKLDGYLHKNLNRVAITCLWGAVVICWTCIWYLWIVISYVIFSVRSHKLQFWVLCRRPRRLANHLTSYIVRNC